MPDKPKGSDILANESDQEELKPEQRDEILSGSERSYYYDDAHGYEDFDPDSRDEEDTED